MDALTIRDIQSPWGAIVRNMARDLASLRWPVPRLVCVLPPLDRELTEDDRLFNSWSDRLKAWCKDGTKKGKGKGKVAGKGKFTQELQLFLLCAHDLSLAECGPDGQGYESSELRSWIQKVRLPLKVGLGLGSIALKVCTGLAIPTDVIDAFGDTSGKALSKIGQEAGFAGVDHLTTQAQERLDGSFDSEQLRSNDAGGEVSYLLI